MTLKIFANKGHGSTSTESKPEPYLTKTESRSKCARGPARSSDFCYVHYNQTYALLGFIHKNNGRTLIIKLHCIVVLQCRTKSTS